MADPNESVAIAAVSVSRAFLRTARGATLVDHLTAIALDRARADTIRAAAIHALLDLEPSTVAPLLAAVRDDPSEVVRAAAVPPSPGNRTKPQGDGEDLDDLAGTPGALRDAVTRAAATASLAALLRVVESAREREAAEPGSRDEWLGVRGAAHVALAGRGSRLAVYDLRESIDSASGALPVDFMAAMAQVGDKSCLEALAAAYARAAQPRTGQSAERQTGWRQQLADAFHAIVTRERLTRRSALLKKIETKWPGIVATLADSR